MPRAVLVNLAFLGAGSVVIILLSLKGPTRGLRIATFAILLAFATAMVVQLGWKAVLAPLAFVVGLGLLGALAASLLHRMPATKHYRPVESADAWPAHGRPELERSTRDLEAHGFFVVGDFESSWTFAGRPRRVVTRFLLDAPSTICATVCVLDAPRGVARALASRKQQGLRLATCDRQPNEQLFRDALTRVERVAPSATAQDMIEHQRALMTATEGADVPVDDVVRASAEAYDAWVQRLLDSGQLVMRGGDAAGLPVRMAAIVVMRNLAAWFS